MRRRVAGLAALALLAPAGDAAARPPVGGGHYQGRAVFLVVVDDGRSLSPQSIVNAPCDDPETPTVYSGQAPRGTSVRADGSFRWRTAFQVVEGRFAADGRTVEGTSRYLGRARDDCTSEPTTFSGSLVRRAAPEGRCEPLSKGRLVVSVYVRSTGCTRATRVVDAWRLDRDCVTTALELRPCRTAGRRCTPVSGGRLEDLAGVACSAGRSRIELVIRESCGQLDFSVALTAINVRCAAARAVGRQWQRRRAAAGWICRQSGKVRELWSCRNGHRAVEIDPRIVIES